MSKLINIFDIIDDYDILLFDIWGVLTEQKPYKHAIDAINEIKKTKEVYIVTNMARTRNSVQDLLKNHGFEIDLHRVFTAGEATRSALRKKQLHNPDLLMYHFDDMFNEVATHKEMLEDIDVKITRNMSEANLMLISQFADNLEDSTIFDKELEEAAKFKLEAFCSNPDTIVVNEASTRYCAGFFAEKYEDLGGEVHYFGKPYLNIYKEVFSTIDNIDKIDKNRILMIGDTLETDVLGAKNADIHSALVATGNMNRFLESNNIQAHDKYNALIQHSKSLDLVPNWIIELKLLG
jgi:HAD superfamily hydrolase (TIGR01459 family)